MLYFPCPWCRHLMKGQSRLIGETLPCPACDQFFEVPEEHSALPGQLNYGATRSPFSSGYGWPSDAREIDVDSLSVLVSINDSGEVTFHLVEQCDCIEEDLLPYERLAYRVAGRPTPAEQLPSTPRPQQDSIHEPRGDRP